MSWDDPRDEARRVLTVCAVCDYCNGYCEMFRAVERRRRFDDGDLDYLAHLCHNCRNCWHACQYAPPHAFAVNVPRVLAELRRRSYRDHAWPRPLERIGLVALAMTLLPVVLTLALVPAETLFAPHTGAGAFYRVIPWGLMSAVATVTLGWSLLALTVGVARFWRRSGGGRPTLADLRVAARATITLSNLAGGGAGCDDGDGTLSNRRRRHHHLLAGGLGLCLASTVIATLFHHGLGWSAPYPALSPPVLLGTLGGGLMLVGAAGLWRLKRIAVPMPSDPATLDAERLLLGQTIAMAASGLILLLLRDGAAMGILLALHLGTVLGFFVLLPHGKIAHAPYRAAALVRAAMERRTDEPR